MQLPRFHRLRAAYLRLEGQRCVGCGALQFPPRPICRHCSHADLSAYTMSGKGTLVSFSEVAQAPHGFTAPYLVALVALDEGPTIDAQLSDVDATDVRIGMRLEMVTRRIREMGPEGYLVYAYKFRPVLDDDSSAVGTDATRP